MEKLKVWIKIKNSSRPYMKKLCSLKASSPYISFANPLRDMEKNTKEISILTLLRDLNIPPNQDKRRGQNTGPCNG